ncbi:hypothetical protein PGT21_014419 [Puccinia graminis f. sp. tritici]|uniref:Uncharacterized protein n=1 Tax=Puccinia graminis f. sp. tritici TaxID=56615 RepID=A0A5B0QII4_PUCGR|nr:hypothetical protein PGT21_014419 [Puccinia graminis f. sp. tritici]
MRFEIVSHTVFQALVIESFIVAAIVSAAKVRIGETSISPQAAEPQTFETQLSSLLGKPCRACQLGTIDRIIHQPGQNCWHIMRCEHGRPVGPCMGVKPVAQPHCDRCFANIAIIGICEMAEADGTHTNVPECPSQCLTA